MANTPDRNPETPREHPAGGENPRTPGSRTAAAGTEFAKALGSDLAELANLLRHWLSRQSRAQIARARMTRRSVAAAQARPAAQKLRRLLLGLAVAGITGMLVLSGALLWALLGLPIDHRPNGSSQATLLLEAADGEPLGRIGPLRMPDAALADFGPLLVKAVLSTEDRRFYSHPGIDLIGILRAAHANKLAGEVVEGGSTITQQLVKLEYLNGDRSYVRKLRQALIAVWLETHLTKDEILTRYLSRVYLGDGAYGMTAAARLFFNKRPADLTLPQAAMLGGLIQAPSDLDPLHHLKAAQARAATVLADMVADHVIDAQAAKAAEANPATVNSPANLAPARSWFADWVAKQAVSLAGAQTGTVRVQTTFVPELQKLAQQVLDDALAQHGRQLGVSQGALVAMRPDGAVLAMVGGRNYSESQFNRAADSNRQPGSAFKLFVYLAALRKGYTPNDLIDAGPVDINGWKPANFDDERYGRITLARAFAQSVNTAAVRLAMDVGLGNVAAAARDLGLTEPLPEVPSLALGSVGVSLVDMTGAFACVSDDHTHVRPWGVAAIGPGSNSRMLSTAPAVAAQSLDPYRQQLVDLLQGVVEHGTGRAAAFHGFAAGKTGTSQDYRDAWFIGFNDALVAGIWVGNDNDSPMKGVVGGSLPASTWKAFMTKATPVLTQERERISLGGAGNALSTQPDNAAALNVEATQGSSQPSASACDVAACSSFYHSFRQSDCTYQPFDGGPRQVCTKGGRQFAHSQPSSETASSLGATKHGQCNVALCSQHYSSFNPSDCTYQPLDGGPRQLCEK